MDISFNSSRLEKDCNDSKRTTKRWGSDCGSRLRRRLDELRAAETLEIMRTLPQARCHELRGDRKDQLAVDLKHPYRLIFEVANDPLPQKEDGGLDWKNVTAIRILEVTDYHG